MKPVDNDLPELKLVKDIQALIRNRIKGKNFDPQYKDLILDSIEGIRISVLSGFIR